MCEIIFIFEIILGEFNSHLEKVKRDEKISFNDSVMHDGIHVSKLR